MNIRIPPGYTAFRTPGRVYLVRGGWLFGLWAQFVVALLEPIQHRIGCTCAASGEVANAGSFNRIFN